MAAAGATDQEIADALRLPLAAIRRSHLTLVPMGEAHDARVQRALYQTAIGGETWEERIDREGCVHRLRKEQLGDGRAQLAWLERRRPDEWGEKKKQTIEVIVRRGLDEDDEKPPIEHQSAPPAINDLRAETEISDENIPEPVDASA